VGGANVLARQIARSLARATEQTGRCRQKRGQGADLARAAQRGDVPDVLDDVEAIPRVNAPLEVRRSLLALRVDPLRQEVVRRAPRLVLLEVVGDFGDVRVVDQDPAVRKEGRDVSG
jgi:hypothetical protein